MAKKKSRSPKNPKGERKYKWQSFEDLVADIQKDLSPNALVTPNDKIIGKSGQTRQIDVSVRETVGQFELLIVIDCKDYKKRVDIKCVEEFMGLVEDVGANKAAIVAAGGYTDGAKKRALQAGIDLLRPVDSGDHPWKTLVEITAVCEATFIQGFSITLTNSYPGPFSIAANIDWRKLKIYDLENKFLGTAEDLIFKRWAEQALPPKTHKLRDFEFVQNPVKVEDGQIRGRLCPVNLTADLTLKEEYYIGQVPVKEVRGMANEITQRVIVKNISTETVEFEHILQNWRRIESLEELAIDPAVITRAIDIPEKD